MYTLRKASTCAWALVEDFLLATKGPAEVGDLLHCDDSEGRAKECRESSAAVVTAAHQKDAATAIRDVCWPY